MENCIRRCSAVFYALFPKYVHCRDADGATLGASATRTPGVLPLKAASTLASEARCPNFPDMRGYREPSSQLRGDLACHPIANWRCRGTPI